MTHCHHLLSADGPLHGRDARVEYAARDQVAASTELLRFLNVHTSFVEAALQSQFAELARALADTTHSLRTAIYST